MIIPSIYFFRIPFSIPSIYFQYLFFIVNMHWPPLTLPLPLESIIGTATACAPTPTRVQIATDADMMMIRCQLDDGWGQPVLRTVHGTHSTLYFAIRVPCWGDLNSRTTQTRSNIISSVTLIKHSKALSLSCSLLPSHHPSCSPSRPWGPHLEISICI